MKAESSQQPLDVEAIRLMNEAFSSQRKLTRDKGAPDYRQRIDNLSKLQKIIQSNLEQLVDAVVEDFGCRAKHEILLAEVFTSISTIKYAKKHLKLWMKPQRRYVDFIHWPATAKVMHQPKGVVGIISPWNYPLFLAFGPMAAALAAGNSIMLKPSEYSPQTSLLLAKLLSNAFGSDTVYTVVGGAEVGQAFSSLPFDHLLFTGSTAVGKSIMAAAAKNLTPVTLELGGKSPVLLHPDFPVDLFASRLIHTKTLNSGQTCVAPDYLLVQETRRDSVVATLSEKFNAAFGGKPVSENSDYASIINERHYQRLQNYLIDAEEKGAQIITLGGSHQITDRDQFHLLRKIPLTLVLDATPDMLLMQEEIFGPILPIVTYTTLDEAVAFINGRDRPLALYYFDTDNKRISEVLNKTVSGNAGINEAVMHVGVDDLPFGGIGASGMGSYHGKEGFETFSHRRGVLFKSRFNSANLLMPPYKNWLRTVLKFLIR
jgi:coniferyl-aldehyde dehydrogenase